MANPELDERVYIALRVARQHHLSIWYDTYQEHCHHTSFTMRGYPHTLEYSFLCSCLGTEQEWRLGISTLKSMVPEARKRIQGAYKHHTKSGTKKLRLQQTRAEGRARALLHQHLTRAQRLELRKTKGFVVLGKDGRTYHLTTKHTLNVTVEHEGQAYGLCVVPDSYLPMSDILLAQKIMLETKPEVFLRLAQVRNLTTGECYESGRFLLGEKQKVRKKVVILDFTEEQLESPREWIETLCRD